MLDWLSKQKDKIVLNFSSESLYIQVDPSEGIDTASTIVVNVYASKEKQSLVPCTYTWVRRRGEIPTEAVEFKGNCFICQPSDVGVVINLLIRSADSTRPAEQELSFGPLRLHVGLRHTIAGVLSTGEYMTRVDLTAEQGTKECLLRVREDTIKISHCGSIACFKFIYDLTEPLIQVNVREPNCMSLVFSERYQLEQSRFFSELLVKGSNMQLTFISKQAKDECLMVIKAFNTKREMKTSALIRKIEKSDYAEESLQPFLELEGLTSDLRKMNTTLKQKDSQINTLSLQNTRLQQEIIDTITSYTAIIQNKFKSKEINQRNQMKMTEAQNKFQISIQEKIPYDSFNDGLPEQKVSPFSKKQGIQDFQFSYQEPRQSLCTHEKQQLSYSHAREKKLVSFFEKDPQLFLNEKSMENAKQKDKHSSSEQQQILVKSQSSSKNKLGMFESPSRQLLSQKESNVQYQSPLSQREKSSVNDNSVISSLHSAQSPRSKQSALQISLTKVIQDKLQLQQKYNHLKVEYFKIKNPQNKQSAEKPKQCDKEETTQNQRHIKYYQSKIQGLEDTLKKEREEHAGQLKRREKQIRQLKEEIKLVQKGQQMLNRSQHLSQQMASYSLEENTAIKAHNEYLLSQNQRLTLLCDRYKLQTKELRESLKKIEASQNI